MHMVMTKIGYYRCEDDDKFMPVVAKSQEKEKK
jgi:hypothetical protein